MINWPRRDKIISRAFAKAAVGGVDDAITLLRRAALASDPQGERAEAMGFILFQHSRFEESAAAFRQSLVAQPTHMTRHYYLAYALARASKWDAAMQDLDQAASLSPDDICPLCARCLLLTEKGEIPAARDCYDKAARLAADKPSAQSAYGSGLLQQCAQSLGS